MLEGSDWRGICNVIGVVGGAYTISVNARKQRLLTAAYGRRSFEAQAHNRRGRCIQKISWVPYSVSPAGSGI